jgi:DNA-binding beta-propeller fold protein YncE
MNTASKEQAMKGTYAQVIGLLAMLALAVGSPGRASALTVRPGDLLLVDKDTDPAGAVIHINPGTGAQTVLSSGGYFDDPLGIALAPDGTIFVTDAGHGDWRFRRPEDEKIIQVDPGTGTQTLVSTGGWLLSPFGIAVEPSGNLIVADRQGRLVRINRHTGQQTLLAAGGYFSDPKQVKITPQGDILVADTHALGGTGAIIQVDPHTGAQSIRAAGGYFVDPFGLAVAADGTLFIADFSAFGGCGGPGDGCGGIIRVDPSKAIQPVTLYR